MKMTTRLNASMSIPGNSVNYARRNQDNANWANPALALIGITAGSLGNFKFDSALYLNVRNAHSQSRHIKFLILALRSVSTLLTPGH
jgi:hypothetical protein